MNSNTQTDTPETDNAARKGAYLTHGEYPETCGKQIVHIDFARKLERERNEAREQIASSAINTNVRLFDLVRYSRASLHGDELINDEEYAWLCGGCEMANSPKGGSPSPRRLEDYDDLRGQLEALRCELVKKDTQLEAMREAVKEAHRAFSDVVSLLPDCPPWAHDNADAALAKLHPLITQ